jgi:Purine catabolism regulatory protein-like family/PucR C-terminal helix-turn-helix domain/GGDEF-like domain
MLTVGDILEVPELELTLAGGAAGAGRPLRWVHASELSDPTPWLRGGELLLTIGRPLDADPGAFVELLAERGLAGVGLGLGFGHDRMPAAAARAADRLGFPAFEIPYHVPFIALTEAVFTRLSDARVAEAERRLAGDLVDDLLAGEVGARELRRRARTLGLRGGMPLALAVLRPAEDGANALARLADAASLHGPASLRDGVVAVLVEAAGDEDSERRTAELRAATGAGAAAVGRVRSDPAELPRSYDEALYALEALPAGAGSIGTYRDLGSIQLLLSLQDERGMALFCDSALGRLVAHDADHGSALVESLRAYIEANGRWAEAAAALNVHRHTLRYRVRKIEELTGRDLSDAGDRLELWLAVRAHELQGRDLEPV